jgi:hypothetical protein
MLERGQDRPLKCHVAFKITIEFEIIIIRF